MTLSGVVFADPEMSFVVGLSRWIDPPLGGAAAPQEGKAAEAAQPVTPSAFEAECVKLESERSFAALSEKLGAKLSERLAEGAEDLESAFTIYLQLLVQWNLLAEKVDGLASELSSSTDKLPELRRTLLLALYALVQQYSLLALRFPLLLRLIKYCAHTGQLDTVFESAEGRGAAIERWVREWGLGDEQQKELWGVVLDAFAGDSAASYEYALKYLSLYGGGDLAADAALRKRLVASVLRAIQTPDQFQCDELAQLPVTQQLASDGEHKQLHKLLMILSRGSYAEFAAFEKEGAAMLAGHGLDGGACTHKMRLLTLVSLAQANKLLTYQTVAEALQVEKAEVETWVMDAIRTSLVSAKIDQVGEKVVITSCIEREFGPKQWERLHTSLGEWRDSIKGLLQVIQTSKPGA